MIGILRVIITRGLGHVDLFRQVTMKKSVLYIDLSNKPTSRNSYRKNNTYRGWFDDRTVSLSIVDPWSLMKPFCDKPSFVAFDRPIDIPLDAENPFCNPRCFEAEMEVQESMCDFS